MSGGLLPTIERQLDVLFMAALAAHEFARHGGDIERCNHHPCDLREVQECVRWKRERAMSEEGQRQADLQETGE